MGQLRALLLDPYRFRVYHRSVIEHLIELDQRLFLWINEKHNSFWDPIMYWASDQWIWIPLYVFLGLLLPHRYQPIKWLLVVWALFVCYSRVYNGVHYRGM
jgi:hypothetical protein